MSASHVSHCREGRPMNSPLHPRLLLFFKPLSLAAGVLAILVGCLVLASGLFDSPALRSFLPGWISTDVGTAAAFLMAGLALFLVRALALLAEQRDLLEALID